MDEDAESTNLQPRKVPEEDPNVGLARERVFPLPLAALDALIWELLSMWTKGLYVTFRRRQLTMGSVEYTFLTTSPNKGNAGKFTLRMISNGSTESTYFRWEPGPYVGVVRSVAFRMMPTWIAAIIRDDQLMIDEVKKYQQRDSTLQLSQQIQNYLQTLQEAQAPPKTDARVTTDNEWARQEIARGRDREEVYQTYLQRQKNVNLEDKQEVAQVRDKFRKAISRTHRTHQNKR